MSITRLVSTSTNFDDVIKQLQLDSYEPIKVRDVADTQFGNRYRIVKSINEQNHVIKWSRSIKENTTLNSNIETINFVKNILDSNNVTLVESINTNYEQIDVSGKFNDFKLNSDVLGESDVYFKISIPIVGRKQISFTTVMLRCMNQMPNLIKNPMNHFIDFEDNCAINVNRIKEQMLKTQNILENFSAKDITTDQLIQYYSDIYATEDIRESKPRIWKSLYELYNDIDQDNYQGNTLGGAFATFTNHLSHKPRKSYTKFLVKEDASKVKTAYNIGRQMINA